MRIKRASEVIYRSDYFRSHDVWSTRLCPCAFSPGGRTVLCRACLLAAAGVRSAVLSVAAIM